eukprot:TRINITY_DN22321_c0_g1_i1.p1 TRINITY_DN22321_c0_g1~~TRINITY_DN22321_c0_g1_i1.p1  ORF type:complete len:264 (+),score=44.31 TRINITY_DN22321_c0_g1_i1:96-887(+)
MSYLEDPLAEGATIAQLSETLVKYDPPEEVEEESPASPMSMTSGCASPSKKPLVPMNEGADRTKGVLDVSETLEKLFPPITTTTEDGKTLIQKVSAQPSSRLEIISLQEQLELRSNLRSTRSTGVCVQREDLYSQCFDELIRQITVTCPERGILLGRLKDEINMTITSYKALIDTICSLGMRKVIQRKIAQEINKEHAQLEYEVQIQQRRVHGLQAKLHKTKRIIEDKQKLFEAQHEEEVRFIKKGNIQLNNELKRLTQAVQQ